MAAGIGALALGIGSLIGAGASVAGAAQGAPKPHKHVVKLPPYIEALQRETARYLAQNLTAQPMSFAEYIAGGEKGGFGTMPALITPREAAGLGLVGKFGKAIPFLDPQTGLPTQGPGGLTPEQLLFLAKSYMQSHQPEAARKTRRTLKQVTKEMQPQGKSTSPR